MDLKISKELAQKLINYLAKQPYIEVFQLISELGQLKPIETPEGKDVVRP